MSTPWRSGSSGLVPAVASGIDGAIEVVEHLEQPDQHFAAIALGIAREFLAHARARILEFLRRLAVLRQVLLHLRVLLGDLALELLDVRRLERRLDRSDAPSAFSPRAHHRRSTTLTGNVVFVRPSCGIRPIGAPSLVGRAATSLRPAAIAVVRARAREAPSLCSVALQPRASASAFLAPAASPRTSNSASRRRVDRDGAAVFERAEQDFVGQPIADLGLDDARQRPGAVDRIVALRRRDSAWPRARA